MANKLVAPSIGKHCIISNKTNTQTANGAEAKSIDRRRSVFNVDKRIRNSGAAYTSKNNYVLSFKDYYTTVSLNEMLQYELNV